MKKVLLMIIDALASRVVQPALAKDKLPTFKKLAELGTLREQSVSIFPSVTPAATSSLITGHYPAQHGILGFHWFDPKRNEVVYYGDDFWVVWNKGPANFLRAFMDDLNDRQLKTPTLFQQVEQANMTAAILNYLIFRGETAHEAKIPIPFNLLPDMPSQRTVCGPTQMYFGDLVNTTVNGWQPTMNGGPLNRFGFNDENSAQLLPQLAEKNALPAFTLAYFPDNDYRSHEVGPAEALPVLQAIDQSLQTLADCYGGLEPMLEQLCLIITGDHSQSDMVDDSGQAGILLPDLLPDLNLAPTGMAWRENDDLLACADMRTAQLYFQQPTTTLVEQTITTLLADERIDQVIWPASLTNDGPGYNIATAERGQLQFWADKGDSSKADTVTDLHQNQWAYRGELQPVDGHRSNGHISFPSYPNAFERIVGGLGSNQSGHLWITAQPGYEFALPETSIHVGGGSHGSLHAQDSLSPLLVAGLPDYLSVPEQPRAVDVAPLSRQVLDIG